ncbi:MAG: hypothetical protein M3250_02800 [Thermoproteota archaeon]|nr:hypothetical protein [Thermoproteota archaeon]
MKISELCKMIEESIHTGKYPIDYENNNRRNLANSVQVINRSVSDDLRSSDIIIEVRIQDLYTISNYIPNIKHLPGIIESDVLDSFKILCRRLERIDESSDISKDKRLSSIDRLH